MRKTLKIIGFLLLILIIGVVAAGTYVKIALPSIAAAPALTIEKTPARVERGKYLANNIAVCMDCHSTRDWTKYAGPLTGGNFGGGGEKFDPDQGFPGVYYARNITPAGIGNWTDGEVFRAVTTGVSRDGSALFPVMPYHSYGQIDKEDIYSIIAYLRTLAPVEHKIPQRQPEFPVNFLINTMPAEAAFTTKPDTADQLQYGKYLVTAASCVMCHSKTDKGNIIPGSEFGGGMQFKSPNGVVTSANITPDKETGLGSWTREAFVSRFKTYADSSYKAQAVGPEELNTPMPWMMYSGMKVRDLEAIYAYLSTLGPLKNKVMKFEKIAKAP
jgi:mono/diheme cytochrome c family protein